MKTCFFLTGDYWHPTDTISSLIPLLFPEDEWKVTASEHPEDMLALPARPDLIVTFKDPIENDQIPTPVWCEATWSETVLRWVQEGTGILLAHAAVTDLEADHALVHELIHGVFVEHPPQCPVTFVPAGKHPITEGLESFTFPDNDEHYVMQLTDGAAGEILGITTSEHGSQPGLWAHEYGQGRVCCVTPGHSTGNLTCPGYVRLLRNAIAWCAKLDKDK